MIYPKWAPIEVINLLTSYESQITEFCDNKFDVEDLNTFAWRKGHINWVEYNKVLIFKKDVLVRLVTRPEMESVWKWVAKQDFKLDITANGGLIGNFLKAIDIWYSTAQVPQSERNDDFKEISKHARLLSLKLQKYRGETQPINSYMALFPTSFKDKYQIKYSKSSANDPKRFMLPLEHFAYIIPPLYELLNQLAVLALNSQIDLPSYFPKKITAENAFRTYLINNTVERIYSLGEIPPPTIVQKFISVALDDYSITPDIVRKSLTMKLNRSERSKYG